MTFAVSALSPGAQAFFYGVATLLFLVAAVITLIVKPVAYWNLLVAGGLTFAFFVLFWNSLALA